MAIPAEDFDTIDPAMTGIAGTTTVVRLRARVSWDLPDKPFPTGSRIVPDLATGYPRDHERREDVHVHPPEERAILSTGAPVTARTSRTRSIAS